MKIKFKCGTEDQEYNTEDTAVHELMNKCKQDNEPENNFTVGCDILFSLYLRLCGDIAKECPLKPEVILFYEWLDDCLCSVNMDEEPILIVTL